MTTIYRHGNKALVTGVSLAAIMMAGTAAQGQSADTDKNIGIEEVVVTAQKRAESVQDVPLAITAFDAAFSKRVNLDDVKDLVKFAPGFAGDSKDSFIDYINIRGISTNDFGVGGDPSAGFFKNGLYQGRNGVVVSSMFDMERAEVLRGPQGFLFGRNAIGGAISLYTAKPDFENVNGHFDGGVGERGILEAEMAINMPVSNNFALRVAAYHSEEDGYVVNRFDPDADKLIAHNKDALRVSAGMRGDNWDATIIGEYEKRDQSGSVYRAFDDEALEFLTSLRPIIGRSKPQGDESEIDSDHGLGNFDRGEIKSISAEINVDLGFATLTSLTGYKDHTYEYAEDFDGMPIRYNDYFQDQSGDYFETELRLVSQGTGPLSWYGGVSYYKEKIDAFFTNASDADVLCAAYYEATCSDYFEDPDFYYNPEGHLESNVIDGDYKGWGAYVDLTYQISEQFELGAGVRYTKDIKDFGINVLPVEDDLGPFFMFGFTTDGFVRASESWDDFTPRFIARYRPNDDWMLYASATKGYKSGGFGSFAVVLNKTENEDGFDEDFVALPGATPNLFDPETVWSYEVGAKGDMLDRRLRTSISVYHYRYQDLQLNFFDAGTKVANVGKVNAYGIEATAQAILGENFDLFLSTSYNHNSIKDANEIEEDSDGNRLGGSPEFTVAGVLAYHRPVSDVGEITSAVEFRSQTKTFGGLANTIEAINPGWTDVSVRLGWEAADGWSVTAYVENVFSATYFDGTGEGGFPFPAHGFGPSRPRTVGVKFSIAFGDGQ